MWDLPWFIPNVLCIHEKRKGMCMLKCDQWRSSLIELTPWTRSCPTWYHLPIYTVVITSTPDIVQDIHQYARFLNQSQYLLLWRPFPVAYSAPLVLCPAPFHAHGEKGSGPIRIGSMSPMQHTVHSNQMHGSSHMTERTWMECKLMTVRMRVCTRYNPWYPMEC